MGGDADATAQIAARDRKLAAAAQLPDTVVALANRLEANDALFSATPGILASEPLAARWYLDLAGLTGKLLPKLQPGWEAAGLTLSPETLADNCAVGRAVTPARLASFTNWINGILSELFPHAAQSPILALCTVLTLVGARIDGRVRNSTGDDAVLILKSLLTSAFTTRGMSIEAQGADDVWAAWQPATDLLQTKRLRIDSRLVCEFVAGGNRPDIKVMIDGVVILVGEVKGRTDLSNVWESWMPQINGHLQTWTAENSQAPRAFFGTIVIDEMINGVTRGGTRHTGLRAFASNGVLSAAYNLANIVEGEPAAVAAFDNLVDQLGASLS
ncbi:hypothetical protein KZX46_21000 (plasmid) [Polymorphobacter sp. PAMC 29334]|uniref:hypothetical protein n=1 Tax=Polymorphobacter sp. PAMC 29334 TaxID=2862331 RepID=UPI001C785908|nr:hypothetical protein [Polymorphobacter sp. PAMC 29334]QYE37037.1 hypothetical protein KZX46_21000 [Polymorphobacter sp. PAMC 29334]